MRKRFNILPTYHFEENTDGQIRGAAERVLRDCTIYGNCGKNLLPYPFKDTTKTINGITFTDNGDGTVTANGTATDTAQFFPKESINGPLLAPGTYTFSGCPKGGDWKTYNIRLTGFTADRDFGNGSTFTLTKATRIGMSLTIVTGTTVENLVFEPQIELGSIKTDYEPYKEVGDSDAESGKYVLPVTASGKNLINLDAGIDAKGVLIKNNDGTYKLTKQPTSRFSKIITVRIPANTRFVISYELIEYTGVEKYRPVQMVLKLSDSKSITVSPYNAESTNKKIYSTSWMLENDITAIQLYCEGKDAQPVGSYTVFKNFQIELGDESYSEGIDYEPYTAPKTTNLLLDAPLGPGESISCREKGLLVPELATIDPNITNYITFGSEVKPSSAKFDYYKY